MKIRSKVDYFDIKNGDVVEVVEFVEAHTESRKDGNDIVQRTDIYKVVPDGSTKIHYLLSVEVEEI
jgi:hypothetical protein